MSSTLSPSNCLISREICLASRSGMQSSGCRRGAVTNLRTAHRELRIREIGRLRGLVTSSYPYAELGIKEFIPSRILCRVRSPKPAISGKSAWQARHIFKALVTGSSVVAVTLKIDPKWAGLGDSAGSAKWTLKGEAVAVEVQPGKYLCAHSWKWRSRV